MKRVEDLVAEEQATRLPNFVEALTRHSMCVGLQLRDKRTLVVKQACATMTAIAAILSTKSIEMASNSGIDISATSRPSSASARAAGQVAAAAHGAGVLTPEDALAALLGSWFQHLFPMLMGSVQLLVTSAKECIAQLVQSVSAVLVLMRPEARSPILYKMIESSKERHRNVKDAGFSSLAVLLSRHPR